MKLIDQLRASLAGAAGPGIVEATDGGEHLRIELASVDRLACAIDRFSLQTNTLRGAAADRLKQVAEKLSASLTYLLEPISPIEIDAEGCTVQMRSNPPHKDADRTTYYELLVNHSGELSLQRYTRAPGQPRTPISAEITKEVLLRLANDFSAAAKA